MAQDNTGLDARVTDHALYKCDVLALSDAAFPLQGPRERMGDLLLLPAGRSHLIGLLVRCICEAEGGGFKPWLPGLVCEHDSLKKLCSSAAAHRFGIRAGIPTCCLTFLTHVMTDPLFGR